MATARKAPARPQSKVRVSPVRTALANPPATKGPASGPAGQALEKRQEIPRLGTHGQRYTGGVFGEEWNAELADWPTRVDKLDEQRLGDSVVASVLLRLRTPGQRATWNFEAGEGLPDLPSVKASAAAAGPATVDMGQKDREALSAILFNANFFGIGAPEYRMATPWTQVCGESFNAQAHGVAFFEVTRRAQDGRLGTFQIVDGIWWMHPRTITKLYINRNGNLIGVLQEHDASYYDQANDPAATAKQEKIKKVIPIEDLVIVVCDKEGANYTGNPRTRPMWLDGKRRNFLSQAQVVDAQKRAVGIPFVRLGANAQGEAKEFAITQAKRLREGGNELSYVVMMEGDEIGFLDMGANVTDLTPIIQAQESRIRSVGAQEQFNLGQAGTGGSRAVAETNSPYFDMVVEYIWDGIRSDFQLQVVEPSAAINFPDVPAPRLGASNVTPLNLGAITQLSSAGGVKFSGDDEQHFRRIYHLPLLSADDVAARNDKMRMMIAAPPLLPGQVPGQPAPGDKGGPTDPNAKDKGQPPAKPAPQPPPEKKPQQLADRYGSGAAVPGIARKLWREPTYHEATYLRLADIDRAYEDFLRDFVPQVRALRDVAVLEALRKMRITGKAVVIGRLRETALRDTMLELGSGLREFARGTARSEIQQQVQAQRGITLDDRDPVAGEPFDPLAPVVGHPARATTRASAAEVIAELQDEFRVQVSYDVQQILDGVTKGIEREMLKALEEGMSEDQARDATRRALLGKSDLDIQRIGRGQSSKSYNGGRAEVTAQVRETLERLPDAPVSLDTVVRSEVLDDATCDPCEGLDGTRVEIDSDDYWSFMPPAKCQGGSNCRGFYVLVVEARQ